MEWADIDRLAIESGTSPRLIAHEGIQRVVLITQGSLERLPENLIVNPASRFSAETVAAVLRRPCYLSLEYALHERNVLPQAPWTLTSVTQQGSAAFEIRGWRYEYVHLPAPAFGGFACFSDAHTDVSIPLATAEKAFCDWLYCRGVVEHWRLDRIASMIGHRPHG